MLAAFAHYADVAGISMLALPGLIAAIVLVVWLCVGIFRSGRW